MTKTVMVNALLHRARLQQLLGACWAKHVAPANGCLMFSSDVTAMAMSRFDKRD